jgi:elongation factor P
VDISTAQFKNGLTIELDGKAYQIVEYQHVKPGKGGAFVRTRLKNVETGGVFEKTFRAGARMATAHVERRKVQVLYSTGEAFYFMDVDNFDQIELSEEQVGDSKEYLKENDEVGIVQYRGDVIGLELPAAVNLTVSQTDPGMRGDTAQGGTKPAVLETGAVVQVPLFIEIGDVVKVDTRSGEYLERVTQ